MRWWLLVMLCGCNQLFALHETKQVTSDAQYFDAPVDAPFACPPIGTTPRFATNPHQLAYADCFEYQLSADAGFALVTCIGQISQGPPAGPFVPVADLASDATSIRQDAWLSPEGDQLVVLEQPQGSGTRFVRYTHAGGDHWTRVGAFVWPAAITTVVFSLSTPTRGSPRRFLAVDNSGYLDEMIDDGTLDLQVHRRYQQGELGVYNYTQPSLTPDGLRLVVYATQPQSGGAVKQSLWYSDRPSIDADFRPLDPLPDVPIVNDPFLTEDCSRLYFSGIGSIWYVQQL
jgi:hypothetical protein